MRPLESWLLTYVLNSVWQVPLIFATAWLAARISRRAGPAFQHRLWVGALFAEVLLPACSLRPAKLLQSLQHWLQSLTQTNPHPTAQITVIMSEVHAKAGPQFAPALLAAVSILYIVTLAFFSTKLGVRMCRTLSLRRRTEPLTLSGVACQSYQRFARLFAVSNAELATSNEIASPITLGIRRPILLLPADFEAHVSSEDLDAALAHEFAHMRRRDFTKNLLYEALSLPAAFHPLLWFTRNRIAETRELLCDSIAADVVAGRQRYARSLLRLASRFSEQPHPTTHAIGILDANHFKNFERRVMNLTANPIELKGARRVATAAICLGLLTAACTSALAYRMQVVAPPIQGAPQAAPAPASLTLATPRPVAGDPPQTLVIDVPPGAINGPSPSPAPTKGIVSPSPEAFVRIQNVNVNTPVDVHIQTELVNSVEVAQESPVQIAGGVIAGNRLTFVQPVYPPDAKAAGLDGTVVLSAVIGKDGTITSLKLISGPDEFAQAAWEAVKQWTYKPYLLNGEPVAVETTITVNFALAK